MPKLIFINEPFAGRIFELTQEKTTAGRGDHNMLVIRDPSVSVSHCEILMWSSEVIVRDLGSSNGTQVEGVLLKNQQAQVKSGQIVHLGAVQARLELDAPESSDAASEQTAIYSMRRFQQALEKEHAKELARAQEAKVPVTAESAPNTKPVTQTSFLPAPPAAERVTTPVVAPKETARRRVSKGTKMLVASLLLTALLFVIRLLLYRR